MVIISMIDVTEIVTETEANVVAEELVEATEETICMPNRYKRNKKLKVLASKLDQFTMKCKRKGWKDAVKMVKKSFAMVDAHKAEDGSYLSELFDAAR